MSDITFTWSEEVALHYYVLAHLDLGRDSANLFDATLPKKDWISDLQKAYENAPNRLFAQVPPIGMPSKLAGASREDKILAESLEQAKKLEAKSFAKFVQVQKDPVQVCAVAARSLGPPLKILRAALWETQKDRAIPLLHVYHCPSLGRSGRGAWDKSTRIVAVSLNTSIDYALCQIFHEEVHTISDALIQDKFPNVRHDTRIDSRGAELHQALEIAAVELGQAIIEARMPTLIPAYQGWRQTWRI